MGDRRRFIKLALSSAGLAAAPRWALSFVHPLDEPAMPTALAARSPLLAVTAAGRRLVAVGHRGQVVLSDDGGRSWNQAKVPVSSDLVAVSFPTEKLGWAVGHGGVILHTTDGGATWVKQMDGRQAGKLAIEYLQKREHESPAIAQLLADEKSLEGAGGTQPFLDVHFVSDRVGYAVGTFNRLFRTEDGGSSWVPMLDRTENPKGLHFNVIAGRGQSLYLAGEQGMVWRLDASGQRFVAAATPYAGTLFGLLLLSPTEVLAYGMRGSVFRSGDAAANWERIPMSSLAGITGGVLLSDSTIVLVTQAGTMEISRDQGKSFAPRKPAQPMPYYGVTQGGDRRLVLVGAEGVRSEMLQ